MVRIGNGDYQQYHDAVDCPDGAALIREREHGTIEHLLVMPVTPFEIMMSKVWSMGLVVLLASLGSLLLIVRFLLQVPIEVQLRCLCAGWR